MKRLLALVLLAAMLSGCTLPSLPGLSGQSGFQGHTTGVPLHDQAPDLNRVSAEEFIVYFQSSPEYARLAEYTDPRDPFSQLQQAKKGAAGKGIKEFYDQQYALTARLENTVEKRVDAWNDTASFDDSIYLYLMPMYSMELSYGATLTEQQEWGSVSSGIQMMFSYLSDGDATVQRNAAHDYTMTYTDNGAVVADHFRAAPSLGMQMLCHRDGELSQMFEYLNPQEGLHIWQSHTERLVIELEGNTITRYAYTKLLDTQPIHGETQLLLDAFPADRDTQAWLDWALCGTQHQAKNASTFQQWLYCDGNSLYITASAFLFGDPPHAVLPLS